MGFSRPVLDAIPSRYLGGRLLDVGCSNGLLVREAGLRGYKATGIDINIECVEYAKSNLNVDVRLADVLSFDDGKFDVVVAVHVLEHFDNPRIFLDAIKRQMAHGSVLILSTPNLDGHIRFFLKLFGLDNKWYAYCWGAHRLLYTPSSLEFLLRNNGFKVELEKYPNLHYGGHWRYLTPLLKMIELLGEGDNMIFVCRMAGHGTAGHGVDLA